MDFSEIQNDSDKSPWATSPQRSKADLDQQGSTSDVSLPSPVIAAQQGFAKRPQERVSASRRDANVVQYDQFANENGHHDSLPDRSREPYQQQQQQQQQEQHSDARPDLRGDPSRKMAVKPSPPQYKLQAKVNGLERSGRKDTILRFDIYVRALALELYHTCTKTVSQKTNLPGFRTTQFRDVRRTHVEFGRLADHLVSANPEAMVPSLPPPATAAGVGTDEDEIRVKANMQKWFNYVCENEVLMRDDEMVRFIEGDPGYSPVIRRSQPATGVRRKVIKQFAPPPDDTPELQEARPVVKRFYLGTMEANQKAERLVKARRGTHIIQYSRIQCQINHSSGLGLAENDFGVKLSALTEQESHAGLTNAYRKLGKVIQTTGDLHAAQGTAEATTLADPLAYYCADAFVVKETLTNRHILLRDLLQAQQTTRSKLSATDRLKSSTSVRRDKVDEAISALDEARSHESYLAQKTERVTASLLQEKRRWFAHTTADVRATIREYVVREIEAERRVLATLEAVRPDVRAIDASGGLSRLGREAMPANRRTNLASSQGPKGDAWSGVQRRPDGLNRSISGSFIAPVMDGVLNDGAINGGGQAGRQRAVSGATSMHSVQEDDEDRVDAKNAASRLATSTF